MVMEELAKEMQQFLDVAATTFSQPFAYGTPIWGWAHDYIERKEKHGAEKESS